MTNPIIILRQGRWKLVTLVWQYLLLLKAFAHVCPVTDREADPAESPLMPSLTPNTLASYTTDYHNFIVPRSRNPKISQKEKMQAGVKGLKKLGFSPVEFAAELLNSQESCFAEHRTKLYADKSSQVFDLLDAIWSDPRGEAKMTVWMKPHAEDIICDAVYKEMDAVKSDLQMRSDDVSADYLETWSVDRLIEPLNDRTPIWCRILGSASQTVTAQQKNVSRDLLIVSCKLAVVIVVRLMHLIRLTDTKYDYGTSSACAVICLVQSSTRHRSFCLVDWCITPVDRRHQSLQHLILLYHNSKCSRVRWR